MSSSTTRRSWTGHVSSEGHGETTSPGGADAVIVAHARRASSRGRFGGTDTFPVVPGAAFDGAPAYSLGTTEASGALKLAVGGKSVSVDADGIAALREPITQELE